MKREYKETRGHWWHLDSDLIAINDLRKSMMHSADVHVLVNLDLSRSPAQT